MILVPHRGPIVLGKIFISKFLTYTHVLRPQDAKKTSFKKKFACVCVSVCMYVCVALSPVIFPV